MRVSIFLLAAFCMCAGASAQAETRGFFSLGAGVVTFDDGQEDVSPTNIYLRVGAAPNRHLELGVDASLTVLADEFEGVDFDVDTLMVYAQGNIPISHTSQLFLLAGWAETKLGATRDGFFADSDDNDVAFGFGLRFGMRENFYFLADYIRYFDDDEFDGFEGDFVTDAFNIGVGGYF